ncbi:MAG: efflux RND transporter periplasmic adaptor subunit [Planctomycetota bacterium]
MKYLFYAILIIIILGILVGGGIMLLKKDSHQGHDSSVASDSAKKQMYHCPMHPTYISDKPGDCPICNMKLVPMKESAQESSSRMEGQATVTITSHQEQLIGVRKEKVGSRSMTRTIRAVGTIVYNAQKMYHINTKIAGWVDKMDCCALAGKFIEAGTRLFSIYSPELVVAQQEYLSALEMLKKAEEAKSPEMIKNAGQLVEATRQKLVFWDISEDQIDQVAEDGKPSRTLWITTPGAGFIVGDELHLGQYITPGEMIYKVADTSNIWVEAEIYEYELLYIDVGDDVEIEVSAYPADKFMGKIKYIYPFVNPTTRTIKVRIEMDNPDYKLKADMYANVLLKKEVGEKLAVPVEAVMDSGNRRIVFVDKSNGVFEPREVKLGGKFDQYYEVVEGLSKDETVVTSGNFLIDSESKLKSATQNMGPGHKHGEEKK